MPSLNTSPGLAVSSPRKPAGDLGRLRHSGPVRLEEVRAAVERGRIDTVLLALPDLQGRLKGKRYDARHFLDRVASTHADMCAYLLATDVGMQPVGGFALTSWEDGYADLKVVPDLSTLRPVPWMARTVLVLGDAFACDEQPVEVAPRQILRAQLERLRAVHGFQVQVGLESEFVLYEGRPATGSLAGHPLAPVSSTNLDYALDHPPALDRFLRRLQSALAGAGAPVEAVKTEASPGQIEITFPYGPVLEACDVHLLLKHAARALAARAGMTATFMAAPHAGVASGLHLHLSLWRDGKPALGTGDGRLSPTCDRAVAGLVEALPELAPLYAPSTNSYRRYAPASFAPTSMAWGYDNRTCAVRVVGHDEGLHLEVRVPGADANPYLATAAVVAAITYGLDRTPPLPPEQSGNAYQDRTAPPLAHTLEEALTWFSESTIAEARLGREVVQHYTRLAQVDLDHQRALVPDTERARWLLHA
ncbi:glutamine synthetase family protein [Streptomyces sp. RGM 3693]|uniref:glutamine synthetase family protein n=1 Tax=Streptomyces sp. RGM 3693 TaxID=3413284 RepID=UPI003D2750CD